MRKLYIARCLWSKCELNDFSVYVCYKEHGCYEKKNHKTQPHFQTTMLTHTLPHLKSRHSGTQKGIRKTLSANYKATEGL